MDHKPKVQLMHGARLDRLSASGVCVSSRVDIFLKQGFKA